MRSLKKMLAVAAASAMTMAMAVSACATTITFHFQNSQGWSQVGAWIYEGVGFTTNVTNAYVYCEDASHDTKKPLWPGALCTDEFGDMSWVSTSADFTDLSKGLVCIFNNFVADDSLNDTTEQCDLDAVKAAGLTLASQKAKEQTSNITMSKKSEVVTSGATEVWIAYDGTTADITTTAPSDYATKAASTTPKAVEVVTKDDNGSAASGSTDSSSASSSSSTTTTTSGSTTSSSSVKTGDTVAVSVIGLAVVAAAVVVATRKKVNA